MKLRSLLNILGICLICFSCQNPKNKTGYIDVDGGKVWYRIDGDNNNTPILVLHGGPGSSSFGLDPLKKISDQQPVIFYDQLGSGRSDRIKDTSLMTVPRYTEEVEQVREHLNYEKVYLYGQSWGTALALEYYLKYPKHVKGIIFSSPYFSTSKWIEDANILVEELPDSIVNIIRKNEKNKTFSNADYQDAVTLFYSKHLRRKERSQQVKDTASKYFGSDVYNYMWGPSEFTATGTLLNYDRVSELNTIQVPVLFLTGEYDEARSETVKYYQSLVPGSKFQLIKNSGHATLNDNSDEALQAISNFLEEQK